MTPFETYPELVQIQQKIDSGEITTVEQLVNTCAIYDLGYNSFRLLENYMRAAA